MSTLDHLVYMANQIARNFGTLGDDAAVEATVAHILKYWDPRMKRRIVEYRAVDGEGLSDIARKAVTILSEKLATNV